MAAAGGGYVRLHRYDSSTVFSFHRRCAPSSSFMVSNPLSFRPRTSKIKATASFSDVGIRSLPKQAGREQKGFPYEKIDDWMRDSVAEIVMMLPDSPLLIHVYYDNDNKTTKTTAEKAEGDDWDSMKQKWKKGESPMPDGVIFVEQIQEEGAKNGEVSRVWGIVVQGKGEDGRGPPPACYLLKTSKVGSGMGLRCTHFCLVKVTSFRETAFSQLKNCWLLQGN
ncbi:hypothetical protein like AT3G56360 [Hibiscus trionum]|uniref:DUF7804 domain-containing protein n=1 Tax=Hibiscus trionum TaxID=183268 RepID=A0A9W7HYG5_HIBTR|nr:hypothetical protein like AT3G56360 [Hibiscus trionum]